MPPCLRGLCLAFPALLRGTVHGQGLVPPQSGPGEPLAAALAEGDECASGGADACALNALQLRRAKSRQHDAELGHAFEAAPAYQGAWLQEGPCSGTESHELLFVVKSLAPARAEQMMLERSDPESPHFRKWLSRDEAWNLMRNEKSLQAVKAALGQQAAVSGLAETAGGQVVRATAPVATWSQLLSTEFSTFRHRQSGRLLVRALHYSVPGHLRLHLAGILKVVELGEILPELQRTWRTDQFKEAGEMPADRPGWNCTANAVVVACRTFEELKKVKPTLVSPDVLRRAYNVPMAAARGSRLAELRKRTSQMVYASLGQHWSPSDRTQFQRSFGLPEDRYVEQLDLGNGMSSDTVCRERPNDCGESNLDVQYMMSMSPWSRIGYYYMSDNSTMHDFLYHFIEDISRMADPPKVMSISYGMPEIGATNTAIDLFNGLALTLALQGVTIIVASGDDGAATHIARSRMKGDCWLVKALGLQVDWPASSPWVTAVGATLGIGSGNPEVACSTNATGPAVDATRDFPPLITSGGGFSQALLRPPWQKGHHDKPGRGVPDVSLAGHLYAVVIGGQWVTVDGTSASSPALAGMISLINAERQEAGLPPVGLLNPLLYRHPDIFTDIVEGDNRCGAVGNPCCGGYDAGPGWDPVTGLGSVDFEKLMKVLSRETVKVVNATPAESSDESPDSADADAVPKEDGSM